MHLFVLTPIRLSFIEASRTPTSLQNNVLLAAGPQSCRVISPARALATSILGPVAVQIMRVEKGFVLPLRISVQLTGRQVCAAVVSAGVQTERLTVAQTRAKLTAASLFPYINLYDALKHDSILKLFFVTFFLLLRFLWLM